MTAVKYNTFGSFVGGVQVDVGAHVDHAVISREKEGRWRVLACVEAGGQGLPVQQLFVASTSYASLGSYAYVCLHLDQAVSFLGYTQIT